MSTTWEGGAMVAPLPTPSKRLANMDERCNSFPPIYSQGNHLEDVAVVSSRLASR